jgi:tRNA(Leu) C34 or U34 (ribose-2'-O)-methylase TrmL
MSVQTIKKKGFDLTFRLNELTRTSLEVPLKRKNGSRNVSNAVTMEQFEAISAFCG